MTRMQILLDKEEVKILRRESAESGKSYSQLVREAIGNAYISRYTDAKMKKMVAVAKSGVHQYKSLQAARQHLWSL